MTLVYEQVLLKFLVYFTGSTLKFKVKFQMQAILLLLMETDFNNKNNGIRSVSFASVEAVLVYYSQLLRHVSLKEYKEYNVKSHRREKEWKKST